MLKQNKDKVRTVQKFFGFVWCKNRLQFVHLVFLFEITKFWIMCFSKNMLQGRLNKNKNFVHKLWFVGNFELI